MSDSLAIIDRMRETTLAIGSIVEVHPLDTPEDESKAGGLLRAIKTLIGEAEKERKALKAPHLKAGKDIDEVFREPRKGLERVEGLIKRRLAEAAQLREAVRVKALAAVQEAVQEGNHEAANAALETIETAPVTSGISERWTYEVESADLRVVPIEYLVLNADRVKAEIKLANKDGCPPKIPGVTFRKVASIVARRF